MEHLMFYDAAVQFLTWVEPIPKWLIILESLFVFGP